MNIKISHFIAKILEVPYISSHNLTMLFDLGNFPSLWDLPTHSLIHLIKYWEPIAEIAPWYLKCCLASPFGASTSYDSTDPRVKDPSSFMVELGQLRSRLKVNNLQVLKLRDRKETAEEKGKEWKTKGEKDKHTF